MLYAAKLGDVDTMKELLARGYVVNCSNEEQGRSTPLHEACSFGHKRAVEFLIAEGAWVISKF